VASCIQTVHPYSSCSCDNIWYRILPKQPFISVDFELKGENIAVSFKLRVHLADLPWQVITTLPSVEFHTYARSSWPPVAIIVLFTGLNLIQKTASEITKLRWAWLDAAVSYQLVIGPTADVLFQSHSGWDHNEVNHKLILLFMKSNKLGADNHR